MNDPKPQEAYEAVLAGHVVRAVIGADAEDPVVLFYLDRTYEFDRKLHIFCEPISGWSEGIKECLCEPDSSFFVDSLTEDPPLSLSIVTDKTPPLRESPTAVTFEVAT